MQPVVQLPCWQLDWGGQTSPHTPQLSGSLEVSLQPVGQQVCSGEHTLPMQPVDWHIEFTHVSVLLQVMSQPPQLFGSVVGSTQMLLQRICVPGHTCISHVLAVQQAPL